MTPLRSDTNLTRRIYAASPVGPRRRDVAGLLCAKKINMWHSVGVTSSLPRRRAGQLEATADRALRQRQSWIAFSHRQLAGIKSLFFGSEVAAARPAAFLRQLTILSAHGTAKPAERLPAARA